MRLDRVLAYASREVRATRGMHTMTRTVFPNAQVAHVWASQSQSEGRSSTGHLYFRDSTIFSYRDGWPLAKFTQWRTPDDRRIVVVNAGRYSVTTSGHLSSVRGALRGLSGVYIIDTQSRNLMASLASNPFSRRNLVNEQIAALVELGKELAKPRRTQYGRRSADQFERIQSLHGAHDELCELSFNLGLGREPPHGDGFMAYDLDAMEATIREAFRRYYSGSKGRERLAALQQSLCESEMDKLHALLHPDAQDIVRERQYAKWRNDGSIITVAEWHDGKRGRIVTLYDTPTFVRRVGNTVETSRGAIVPFEAAKRLYLQAAYQKARGEAWSRDPADIAWRIGSFAVQSIDAHGNAKIGCHHLRFDEMERLAIREVPHLVKPRYPLPALVASHSYAEA